VVISCTTNITRQEKNKGLFPR